MNEIEVLDFEEKPKKRKLKKSVKIFLILVSLVALTIVTYNFMLSRVSNDDKQISFEIKSGSSVYSVGEKLKSISKLHQVLCVTHLASIAAKGDYNYYIYKKVENEKTITNVELLNEEETIKEIARIASGDITEISLQHARELRG